MKAVPKNSRLCYVLFIATALISLLVDADAQTAVVDHPPISIVIPPNLSSPSIHRVTPVSPGIQPLQPLATPAAGTPCAPAGSQPAPIAAVVLALKCDADLIFEYVYNNIEFEPLYGSNKGPLGTLLDSRGGDADQAMLFSTMLNSAGYSPSQVQIAWSMIRLTGAQLANWLGVPNDALAIENLLNAGGIPTANFTPNSDGTLNFVDLGHFAVSLTLNGTSYLFDPSFKQHVIVSGIANLAAALGYSRTQFLSDAGGTIDSVSISNVNRVNLRADLANYASNLVSYINQNNRTWSVGNIIGGMSIQPLVGSPIRQTSFPHVSPAFGFWETFSTFPATCPFESYTAECRTYINLTMPGASPSQAVKLYTDQVYGHRTTVFSMPAGGLYVPTLLIDGALPSCVGSSTCTNLGPATVGGQNWSINAQVVQSNQNPNATSACGAGITACKALSIVAGGAYLFSTGTGRVGRGTPEYHRQLVAQARAAGTADSSELVLGESLAAIGYAWLAECSAEQQIADRLAGTTTLYYFGVGIVGQSNIQQTGFQGPYVDLPVNNVSTVPGLSASPTTTIGAYSYPTPLVSAFFSYGEALSAFESGVLEQTQAPVANMTAASTIKIIDANMDSTYSGALLKTFFADGTTAAGQATYNSTIQPAISSHYASADLSAITSLVTGGWQVLIPENGQLAIGIWKGAGYTGILPQSAGEITITQKISGGMSGGFSGIDIPDPTENVQETLFPSPSLDELLSILVDIPTVGNSKIAEPVDSITGAYIYQHDDLKTGGGDFPYALPFSRIYLSSSGGSLSTTTADIGIGNGWGHTYSASAQVESDPYIGMGEGNSPAVSTATSIAALFVMHDLLSVTPTAQTMTISSMAARWFIDQLTGNVVMVQQPNTMEEFVSLPHADGATAFAYNSPPGSSVRFTQAAAGQYAYTSKDAVTMNFGPTPAGALQGWTFPNGMAVNLTYAGSQLSKITNNLGRSLSLTYGDNDIASVTDDTGRTASYAYSFNHNLTSFTDPLGATTTYSYDISGIYDRFGHLTQIFYPSRSTTPYVTNWYDPLGRVIQQANGNGNATNFYFAGSRTEIVDALGNRHVTYQTDRGKVLKDASVLSASFGDVFSDTVQQNGVVNVTTNQYDGLDRLTLTTLPEGGTTAYSYATAVNPWASNIASITSTAKPGSPLPPLTASFLYDPVYNSPTQITDPLGLVSTHSYAPATGNLVTSVADPGTSPHFNATTQFTYDAKGRPLTASDPNGIVTTFIYDSLENLIKQVADSGASGHLNATMSFGYDALGNIVSRTDPNGNITTMSYDADRRLTTTTAPAPFNSAAVLVQTTDAYDPDGHLVSVTRSNGASNVVTNMSYTATGQMQTTTDANGNATTNSYDADDRLASVTDPLFRRTVYTYDAMSRRVSVSNPAIQAAPLLQQSYTPDGLIASLTDANLRTTNFTSDGFDRLSTTTYPNSSTEVSSYDADGNVVTHKTRAGTTISFSYDTLNRLSSKAAPSEPTVSYAYDRASHLIGVGDSSASIAKPVTSASYIESLVYDQINRPLTVIWSPAPNQTTPGPASASFNFGYDATNRRVSQSATDKSWWNYPTAAKSIGYTVNNLNQYSTVGAVTPSYDGNGNLTFDGTFTYGYDAENRLISASGAGLSASYTYNAQGRRKSKTVNGTTTIFVTDADNREVLEYDGTGGATGNWYSYAPASTFGADAVLNQMNVASAARQTLVPDVQGSITGTLDATSGVLTKIGYQAYGENPGLSSGTYRYTARRFDPETAGSTAQPSGLYYYRARMYSPTWGRFLQPDPIGFAGGSNLYAYAGNDPINNADSGGLWGFGRVANVSAEGGLFPNIGVGFSGSYGSGVFTNSFFGPGQPGQFASAGAFTQFLGMTTTTSTPLISWLPTGALGASAGVTAGYFFTNANSATGLHGTFDTFTLNVGPLTLQFGWSNGTGILTITGGPATGASASIYPTNTFYTHDDPASTISANTPPVGAPNAPSVTNPNDLIPPGTSNAPSDNTNVGAPVGNVPQEVAPIPQTSSPLK